MNVKRYIAEDVTGAMEKIRSELGGDAYILNTRKLKRKGLTGLFKKPLVEVVAAYEPAPPPPGLLRAEPTAEPIPAPKNEKNFDPLPLPNVTFGERVISAPPAREQEKMADLESKLDSISATLGTLVGKVQMKGGDFRANYAPEIENLLLSLIENEVHEEFAHKISREVSEIAGRESVDVGDVMEQILKQYLGEAAPIKLKKYKRTVVIFIGPTGVGKTTSLAKLAAIYALNHHARVGIITTDTFRIAAIEQLKTYAEILQVPLTVVYAPDEMKDALQDHEQRDIVFIDTAGKSPSDPTLEGEVLSLIRESDADEVHLVLSATTSFSGCLNIINTYSFLKDFKLLFTKMDETPTWGMLLNLKFLTDRMISYMAAGQTVPDDIEVANPGKIAAHLMGRK